jgi:hypothetical protein
MASHDAREIGCYLRNGSLWVGYFVADGTLNFGDDRFDSAHGLANVACTRPTSSASVAARQVQTRLRAPDVAREHRTARGAYTRGCVSRPPTVRDVSGYCAIASARRSP